MTTAKDFPAPPFTRNVSGKYGAPMGRTNDSLDDFENPVRLVRVPLGGGGDYDQGGAYWGGGRGTLPLFCAWDAEGHEWYTRARSFEAAKAELPTGFTVFEDEDTVKEEVLKGMISILWGSAWADHAEDHGCYNLSGCAITACAPEAPKEAVELATELVADYEKANECTISELYARALVGADTSRNHSAERFGDCLAFKAMGAGVGWTDDHEDFGLKRVRIENYELQQLAGDTCEDEGNPRHEECGGYYDPDEPKCRHCGEGAES